MNNTELKSCPFCGGHALHISVDGGCLPSITYRNMGRDKREEIWTKTPYVTSCSLYCDECGAMVEGYAASADPNDDLYNKAIENCYEKWNRRADEKKPGKWIKKIVRGGTELYCSECDCAIDVIYKYNFCPNCGHPMESEE